MSVTRRLIWAAGTCASLGLWLGPGCPAAAQPAQRSGLTGLPQAPQPQIAQASVPNLPAPPPPSGGLTWEQVKAKFEAANPVLKSDQANVDEMKAEEITAYLRPNPQFTMTEDGTAIAPHDGSYQPFKGTDLSPNFSYLHERDHKRELRLESAKEGTQIATSQHEDLDRNMLFTLRSAFVQTLEAKAVLELAKADLDYYDKIIDISKARFNAGDLAQIDLDRIELLRVQYESEIQTAIVNLRTAKIALLQLLNDRTPVDQFDVSGPFDFASDLKPLTDFEQAALDARPDLRAAIAGYRAGEDQPQAGDRERLDRPDLQRLVHVELVEQQSERAADAGPERGDSAAHLRPQPGREAAHADRHRPQPAVDRRSAGAGVQRRGLGLRAGAQQHRAAEAVPRPSTTTRPRGCATP